MFAPNSADPIVCYFFVSVHASEQVIITFCGAMHSRLATTTAAVVIVITARAWRHHTHEAIRLARRLHCPVHAPNKESICVVDVSRIRLAADTVDDDADMMRSK